MKTTILTFSFKRGLPEDPTGNGGGFVFDCRAMPNPFWDETLRNYTGLDKPVADFFTRHTETVEPFLDATEKLVRLSFRRKMVAYWNGEKGLSRPISFQRTNVCNFLEDQIMKLNRIIVQFSCVAFSFTMSLPTGCVVDTKSNINNLAVCLVAERLSDCALVKITQARYVKSRYNDLLNMNEVLYVVDGVVECVISESALTRLPPGTAVRDIQLVDDVVCSKKILDKMAALESMPVELKYTYGFFEETPPPDDIVNRPVAGSIYSPSAHWLFSEFYSPDIPMQDTDIIKAFRTRAIKSERHSKGE